MNTFRINLVGAGWASRTLTSGESLSLKGQAYLDQAPIEALGLAAELVTCTIPDQLTALLLRLNGFYAWVNQSEGQVRAAVDHIRSRPLFYGLAEGRFYLSDEAEWVRQQVGDREMDPLAREEFQLAGYVTGAETLFPNVKQLQAGEYLIARQTSTGAVVETHRYYRFLHQEPDYCSEAELRSELNRVTVQAVKRLIDYANGRQIVIPLSGGYDSRLIAAMLKRFGYLNILCFTYGRPGNKEAEFSRKVAEALGFRWVFIEYSAAMWREEWSTPQAAEYRELASNHVSLPHVQDWLAIKILMARGEIQIGAVVVPGHSGDFVAGSHIPEFVFEEHNHSEETLMDSLRRNHLSNCPSWCSLLSGEMLAQRIKERIGLAFDGTDVCFANSFELWDWQERQSKYIVNSVRVYDQFGLSWWLPLWDLEFVRFWQHVPLRLRKGREWYKNWVAFQYYQVFQNSSHPPELSNADDSGLIMSFLISLVKRLPPFMRNHLRTVRDKKVLSSHFLAFEGLVSDGDLNEYLDRGFNIIGIYSDLYLSGRWR